jgi:cytidine deaminase
MYTSDGEILISTSPEVLNASVALCHETGAICEAYTKGKRITASVCVTRAEDGSFLVLAPCGVCQERLWYWGGGVEVAVPAPDSPRWRAISLREISPHYWRKAFEPER